MRGRKCQRFVRGSSGNDGKLDLSLCFGASEERATKRSYCSGRFRSLVISCRRDIWTVKLLGRLSVEKLGVPAYATGAPKNS